MLNVVCYLTSGLLKLCQMSQNKTGSYQNGTALKYCELSVAAGALLQSIEVRVNVSGYINPGHGWLPDGGVAREL